MPAVGEAPFSPFSEEGKKRLHTSLSSNQLAELLRSQNGQVRLRPLRWQLQGAVNVRDLVVFMVVVAPHVHGKSADIMCPPDKHLVR